MPDEGTKEVSKLARQDLEGQVGGGGYDDFDFVITDAWFGPAAAFTEKTGEAAIFCHWVGNTTMEEVPTLTDDGFHPSFKLGADWEVTNDGKSVKYLGSGKGRFGSWYGRVLGEVLTLTEDVADTDADPFTGDKHPRDAVNWIGTKWHMENKKYKWGGDFGESERLMPVSYLGMETVGATVTTSAAPAAAANGGGARDAVIALAKSAPDYKTFQSAALLLPGVSTDSALILEIADESKLYATANS